MLTDGWTRTRTRPSSADVSKEMMKSPSAWRESGSPSVPGDSGLNADSCSPIALGSDSGIVLEIGSGDLDDSERREGSARRRVCRCLFVSIRKYGDKNGTLLTTWPNVIGVFCASGECTEDTHSLDDSAFTAMDAECLEISMDRFSSRFSVAWSCIRKRSISAWSSSC